MIRVLVVCMLVCSVFRAAAQGPRKAFIPRTIDWGYRIIEGDSAHPRKRLIFPFPIISYKPETRWILGISVTHIFRLQKDSFTRPSLVRLNLAYSQNHQASVRPMFDIFTKENKYNIKGAYMYTNFGEYFWGLGVNAPESDKEMYSFRLHRANVKAARLIGRNFYLGAQLNLEQMYHMSYATGGLLDTGNITGSRGSFSFGPGLTCYYDSRNNIYFPTAGSFVEVSNVFYSSVAGSNYNFTNLTMEGKKFIRLWNENVLALHGYLNINAGEIPFRMLGTLGSESYMRGYYNGRYRDNHAVAVQAELRKQIWGPVGMVAFIGGGTVSHKVGNMYQDIRPTYGLGLRVKAIPSEKINARFDYGFGPDGKGAMYIGLNEAF
jgi:outer membrane protein assembly factor BamA